MNRYGYVQESNTPLLTRNNQATSINDYEMSHSHNSWGVPSTIGPRNEKGLNDSSQLLNQTGGELSN